MSGKLSPVSLWRILGVVSLLALALVGVQLLLPELAANRVEDRLKEGGGSVEVELSAFPAAKLLLGDGNEIEVRGGGLDLDLDESEPRIFDHLDGFGRVDVDLVDFRAGPFAVRSFHLARDGEGPYRLDARAMTSASELVGYGSARFGLPGGALLGAIADRTLGGRTQLPVALRMELESHDGTPRVVSGNGAVAGIPTGPLGQLLTAVIVARL